MDIALPLRSIAPAVEAEVLRVLSSNLSALAGREVARLIPGRSQKGVSLALNRLVAQGIVKSRQHVGATHYQANREHLMWPGIEALLNVSRELESRISDQLGLWSSPPVSVAMFGSAARRDGDLKSDIDLVIVERPVGPDDDGEEQHEEQVFDLSMSIRMWTGNSAQMMRLNLDGLKVLQQEKHPILAEWKRDSRTLFGEDFIKTLKRAKTL